MRTRGLCRRRRVSTSPSRTSDRRPRRRSGSGRILSGRRRRTDRATSRRKRTRIRSVPRIPSRRELRGFDRVPVPLASVSPSRARRLQVRIAPSSYDPPRFRRHLWRWTEDCGAWDGSRKAVELASRTRLVCSILCHVDRRLLRSGFRLNVRHRRADVSFYSTTSIDRRTDGRGRDGMKVSTTRASVLDTPKFVFKSQASRRWDPATECVHELYRAPSHVTSWRVHRMPRHGWKGWMKPNGIFHDHVYLGSTPMNIQHVRGGWTSCHTLRHLRAVSRRTARRRPTKPPRSVGFQLFSSEQRTHSFSPDGKASQAA